MDAVWRKSAARRLGVNIYKFTDMLALISHWWRLYYDSAGRAWMSSARLARDPASWSAALQQAKNMWANMAPAAAASVQVDDDKEEEGEGDDVSLLLEDG